MNKGLEALKKIYIEENPTFEDYQTIEKELKALEIIKKNSAGIVWKTECSKEDIDFVKEVML